MSDWRDIAGDQNLRLSQKLLEQQGEINQLRAERNRALKTIRQAYEAGDDAWLVCANALQEAGGTLRYTGTDN